MKKRTVHGAVSDNEVSSNGQRWRRRGVLFGKATRSDAKLLNKPNLKVKRFVRASNSMNDLSVIKTPKNYESSIEDLHKIDDGMEERRRRPRQRSSSLDMGRGNCSA